MNEQIKLIKWKKYIDEQMVDTGITFTAPHSSQFATSNSQSKSATRFRKSATGREEKGGK